MSNIINDATGSTLTIAKDKNVKFINKIYKVVTHSIVYLI